MGWDPRRGGRYSEVGSWGLWLKGIAQGGRLPNVLPRALPEARCPASSSQIKSPRPRPPLGHRETVSGSGGGTGSSSRRAARQAGTQERTQVRHTPGLLEPAAYLGWWPGGTVTDVSIASASAHWGPHPSLRVGVARAPLACKPGAGGTQHFWWHVPFLPA